MSAFIVLTCFIMTVATGLFSNQCRSLLYFSSCHWEALFFLLFSLPYLHKCAVVCLSGLSHISGDKTNAKKRKKGNPFSSHLMGLFLEKSAPFLSAGKSGHILTKTKKIVAQISVQNWATCLSVCLAACL